MPIINNNSELLDFASFLINMMVEDFVNRNNIQLGEDQAILATETAEGIAFIIVARAHPKPKPEFITSADDKLFAPPAA